MPLSKFLRAACERVRAIDPGCPAIFSYADPGRLNPLTGRWHGGFIYYAARFKCFGPSRVTHYFRDLLSDEIISSQKMYRRWKTKAGSWSASCMS
jgi:hypothetical protein